jgi:hypothetical protein
LDVYRIVFLSFNVNMAEEGGKQQFEINCACRGFHVYRNIWSPKLKQILQVEQELWNTHDPFAISLGAKVPGKVTDFEVVGHIPREISRFCHYFINYGGKLEAHVRNTKYRPSPIPSGGLEIPILLVVKKGTSTSSVFQKMENFIKLYYLEPDKICPKQGVEEDDHFEDVFVPDTEEESVENSPGGTTDFIVADSLVSETEEEEEGQGDDTCIVNPETIVID